MTRNKAGVSSKQKAAALIIMIMIALGIVIMPAFSYAEKESADAAQTETSEDTGASEEEQVAEPEITATSAIVYCENTGEILYQKNEDTILSPWSITKLLTALLVVRNLPMDQKVTVSPAAAMVGGSTMNLKAGEVLTVEELLYGLLITSGNDAAYALGEAVGGGDINKFVKMMNQTAQDLGCKNTRFNNPHGLKHKDHYTTAEDFLKIARTAFADPTVRKIAGTQAYTVPKTNKSPARKLKSHTDLLGEEEWGIIAGKTGYGGDTECTIAVEYQKKGLELYIVLIQTTKKERPEDLKKLITYSEKTAGGIKVVSAGEEKGTVKVRHGAVIFHKVLSVEDGYAYIPKEASPDLITTETVLDSGLEAPMSEGDEVGVFKIYVGGTLINTIPLVLADDVEIGWFPSYIYISNRMSLVILCAAAALVIIIVSARSASKRKAKRRAEERQKEIEFRAKQKILEEENRRERGWTFHE